MNGPASSPQASWRLLASETADGVPAHPSRPPPRLPSRRVASSRRSRVPTLSRTANAWSARRSRTSSGSSGRVHVGRAHRPWSSSGIAARSAPFGCASSTSDSRQRCRRLVHHHEHLRVVGARRPHRARRPQLRGAGRPVDRAVLPVRAGAARQVAQAVASGQRRPVRGAARQPVSVAYGASLGYVPSPSWADVFFLAFYPLLVAGLLQFPKAVATRAEAMGFALDAVGRALRRRHDRRLHPDRADVRVGGGKPALADRLGRLPAGRRAPGLRPRVARRPPTVPAARREHRRARDRPSAPARQRPPLQLPDHRRWQRQRDRAELHGRALLDPRGLGGLRAVAQEVRRRPDQHEIVIPNLFAYLVAYVAATAGFAVLLLAAARHARHLARA